MAVDFRSVLAAAQRGEGWAFDALFVEWNRSITSFVRQRGVRESDDLVNEIFLGAFRSIGSFRGGESDFRAWFFRIARNKIVDHHRRAGRQPNTLPLETLGADPSLLHVEADVEQRLADEQLIRLLDRLTDEQREVLLLRTVGDLTIDQIAKVMGKRRGAVKQLQRRAARRLETMLSAPDAGGDTR